MALPGAQVASAAPDRMAAFDRAMDDFISANGIPGGSLAVIKDGRLVYSRGYGWAETSRVSSSADSIYRLPRREPLEAAHEPRGDEPGRRGAASA